MLFRSSEKEGRSMGTSKVGIMLESMGLQSIHFSWFYNPPQRLTFLGCHIPLLLTMTDKIEKEVVLQLMKPVDDEMKDRR